MNRDKFLPVDLKQIIFNERGFCRYTKLAINLALQINENQSTEALGKEKAFVNRNGILIIKVCTATGSELSSFKFTNDEYSINNIYL